MKLKVDKKMAIMNKKNKSGFTMVELLLVVSIISVVAVSITIPLRSGRQVWESGDRYAEVMQNALIGMDKMTRELKYAKQIISVSDSTNTQGFVEFKDRLDTTKRFQYTTADGNLRYGPPDSLSILTGPVSSLRFSCFQSDGSVPTTTPAKVAVILVEMTTNDSQGEVPNIPLKTKVRVRMDKGDDIMKITDYAMYSRAGITIKNHATIISSDPNRPASIGALFDLKTKKDLDIPSELANGVEVYGDIVIGGRIVLENNALAAQDIFVNNKDLYGNDYTTGYAVDIKNTAIVEGNVNSNGNVNCSGTINGYVNLSPTSTITPDQDVFRVGVPPLKFYNPLPPATTFTVGTDLITVISNGNRDLSPNMYGDIVLNNSSSLNLTAGRYYFNSLSVENPGCTININFTSITDTIQIFIANNVNGDGANGSLIMVYGDGDDRDRYNRVYTEVQGDFSWNGCWQGTLFAPNGIVSLTNNTAYALNGAIYSGGTLTVSHPNTDVIFTPAIPSILPWINPIN